MGRTAFYDEVVLTYQVTEGLAIPLVELCTWRPTFPRCRYCGANEFWNIVWPTGLALARSLARAGPAAGVRGRRVLVVGCGVELESVVLAKLGARVAALDHVPTALQLVERNCEQNGLPAVHTICCCWRDTQRVRQLGRYELLIGSDVLYEPEDGQWLQALLTTTLSPDGRALFADPLREGVEEFFEGLVAAGFRVTASQAQTRWLSGSAAVRIYEVERTSANRPHA